MSAKSQYNLVYFIYGSAASYARSPHLDNKVGAI